MYNIQMHNTYIEGIAIWLQLRQVLVYRVSTEAYLTLMQTCPLAIYSSQAETHPQVVIGTQITNVD